MAEQLAIVFPGWFEFALVCLVFFVAEILYVALGFGAGLLCVGILAVFMPVIQDVVVLILLVNLPVELVVVWNSRKLLRWRGLFRILLGIGAGIMFGAWILTFGAPTLLLGILGVFLVVSGSGFALIPMMKPLTIPVWWEPLVGIMSGILAGLFGTGGPPLIYFYQLKGSQKSAFRGSLMALFLFMSFIRIPTYCVTGLITQPRLIASLSILPIVILGAFVGNQVHFEIGELTFRRLVGIILAIIGGILLFRL